MARGTVSLNSSGVRTDANAVARDAVRRITRRVLTRSTVLCPVDSGRLRASGRMKIGEGPRGPQGVVEYPVNYAAAVHDGSRPHKIKARKKKALKFQMGGRTVYAKEVRHPGAQGRPFLRMAAEEIAGAEGLQFRRQSGN